MTRGSLRGGLGPTQPQSPLNLPPMRPRLACTFHIHLYYRQFLDYNISPICYIAFSLSVAESYGHLR